MLKFISTGIAGALVAATLIAAPAFAQTSGTASPAPAVQTAPAAGHSQQAVVKTAKSKTGHAKLAKHLRKHGTRVAHGKFSKMHQARHGKVSKTHQANTGTAAKRS